jgi:hypothetical protein
MLRALFPDTLVSAVVSTVTGTVASVTVDAVVKAFAATIVRELEAVIDIAVRGVIT